MPRHESFTSTPANTEDHSNGSGYSSENLIEQGSVSHWTRRECILDVPNDTDTLTVIFGIKHATGEIWIDNVRLEKQGEG